MLRAATHQLVFAQMAQQSAVVSLQQTESLRHMVVFQRRQVIVLDGQRVAGLDQEVVVHALVVQIMTDCREWRRLTELLGHSVLLHEPEAQGAEGVALKKEEMKREADVTLEGRAPFVESKALLVVEAGTQCSIPVDPEGLADFFQKLQLAKQEDIWRKNCGHSGWLCLLRESNGRASQGMQESPPKRLMEFTG
ncbi:MAG: hypothetical protein FRX49_06828 [Trebouxia sp. A1-2]|nr:MAG: hypothetical protein FRX49_06828 [Trebouxia sp. A1-2]